MKVQEFLFTYTALNDTDDWTYNTKNSYLTSSTTEKWCIICGKYFGLESVVKVDIIHRAVCGEKAAGTDFIHFLRSCIECLGFTTYLAISDIWIHLAIKSNSQEHYEHVILCIDDALVALDEDVHII